MKTRILKPKFFAIILEESMLDLAQTLEFSVKRVENLYRIIM